MADEKQITWFQVNNIVPLIGSAVMIALSWAALNTRIALIEQKLDQVIALQEKSTEARTELVQGQNANSLEIDRLKSRVTILER